MMNLAADHIYAVKEGEGVVPREQVRPVSAPRHRLTRNPHMFLRRYWGRKIILEGPPSDWKSRGQTTSAPGLRPYTASHHLIIARIPVFY